MWTSAESVPSLVAAKGDPRDIHVMSGQPFHFLDAGIEKGLFDGPLPTHAEDANYRARRAAWTFREMLRGNKPGGFAVSKPGIDTVWRKVEITRPCRITNCFQLYPMSIVRDKRVGRWYFIDQTLTQLFEGQDYRVPAKVAENATALERVGYHAAEGIIAHSRWAARSVIEDYDVPPENVHIVLQAANLDRAVLDRWVQELEAPAAPYDRPLRLVFVGRQWLRKGLDRLLVGFSEARRAGCDIALTVIGMKSTEVPEELAATEGVAWHGLIDKAREPRRFIELVGSHDVGCLLSRREPGSNGLHEYHALGLAVIGTTAGGSSEQALPKASVLVDADAPMDVIAESIAALDKDRERVFAMKKHSWAHRPDVLWPTRVDEILRFWPTSGNGRAST